MKNSAKNKLEQAHLARENKWLAKGHVGTPKGQQRCHYTTLELLEAYRDVEQQFAWADLGETDCGMSTDHGLALLATVEERSLRAKHSKSESAEHSWVWIKIFEHAGDFDAWEKAPKDERLTLLQDLIDVTKNHIDHDEHTGTLGALACDAMVEKTRAEGGANWQDHLTPDVTDADWHTNQAAEQRSTLSSAGQVVAQAVASSSPKAPEQPKKKNGRRLVVVYKGGRQAS